jgi:PAS domain S-box-containing protein
VAIWKQKSKFKEFEMAEIRLRDQEYSDSKTDLRGNITHANEIFIKMSGYSVAELKGKPHNIIRHPDMPKIVFRLLWDRLKAKKEIFAYVVNKSKNGDHYWVFANVTPTITHGQVVDYHSVRRKPSQKAMSVIPNLYRDLLQQEKSGGVTASEKYLNKILEEKGLSYDQFIASLQG